MRYATTAPKCISATGQKYKNAGYINQSARFTKTSVIEETLADIQEIARESEGLLEINAVMENIDVLVKEVSKFKVE
jgi:hypothetical protein